MADTSLLRALYIFQGLPDSAFDELLRLSPVRHWPRGTTLFEEGEAADVAVLLLSGELFATVGRGADQRQLGTVRPGEVVGEQAIFTKGGRRNASVTASVDSVGLLLTDEVLVEGASNQAIVAIERQLLASMARRIRRADLEIKRAWRAQDTVAEPARSHSFRDAIRRVFGGRK
jgi:CRP/FNR family transcriptional regulator, cyclic AMP receptor protein